MTRPSKNRSSLHLLVSSTLGTTLVSILAAWVVSSLAFAPVVAITDTPSAIHSTSDQSSRPHFRISPIPPGADSTS